MEKPLSSLGKRLAEKRGFADDDLLSSRSCRRRISFGVMQITSLSSIRERAVFTPVFPRACLFAPTRAVDDRRGISVGHGSGGCWSSVFFAALRGCLGGNMTLRDWIELAVLIVIIVGAIRFFQKRG